VTPDDLTITRANSSESTNTELAKLIPSKRPDGAIGQSGKAVLKAACNIDCGHGVT
jgi:hypothetical protein